MNRRPVVSVLRRRSIYGLTAVACLGAALVNATPSAVSVVDPKCPPAATVTDADTGKAVHGLTVQQHGTTPMAFNGTVQGVLSDGIAPGVDMIMVELHSTAIDDAGVWAGMSGSPVYDSQGNLIGAVAYGLTLGNNPVAGVTPAAEMQKLLSQPPSNKVAARTVRQASQARTVSIPSRTAAKLVRSGVLTRAQASGGFTRLPLPVAVSGMNGRSLKQLRKFSDLRDVRFYKAGAVTGNAPTYSIEPGGNLAASLSYGDFTEAGIGTATAVCGNEVLAFGHPLLWSGPSQLTMHGASAIRIMKDPFVSFKLANLGAPVGGITQDRRAGIFGLDVASAMPDTTTITAHVESSAPGSTPWDGTTWGTVRMELPFIAAFHLLTDEDKVNDRIGEGSARVTWTVTGKRSDGTAFTFHRVDRFASQFDLTFETIFESYEQISRILDNKFDRGVTISSVHYTSELDPAYKAYRLGKIERKVGGTWVTMGRTATVQGGSTMRLRATIVDQVDGHTSTVPLTFHVPNGRRTLYGSLQIAGGASLYGVGGAGKSFDSMLQNMSRAPHNNSVVGRFVVRRPGADFSALRLTNADEVVTGESFKEIRIR